MRFVRRLWRIVNEVAEAAPRRRAPATRARPEGARDDRAGHRRHRPPGVVQHGDRRRDGARERAGDDARTIRTRASPPRPRSALIQPYAPHVAEELWAALGHERLWEQPWPVADQALLVRETFELVVQVNGKVRDRFEVPSAWPRRS